MLVAVLGWRVLASPGPAAVIGTWVSGVYNFSAFLSFPFMKVKFFLLLMHVFVRVFVSRVDDVG